MPEYLGSSLLMFAIYFKIHQKTRKGWLNGEAGSFDILRLNFQHDGFLITKISNSWDTSSVSYNSAQF